MNQFKMIKRIGTASVMLWLLFGSMIANAGNGNEMKLWYAQPAKSWDTEALPIGNGRMGAMLFGEMNKEHIQFNEQSLWSGDNNWDGGYSTGDRGFGSYRNFGDIFIDFNNVGEAKSYQRSLDIITGIHTTTFESNGIKIHREAFASYPDQVLVFRYTANKKGTLSGKISMTSAQGAAIVAQNYALTFSGVMPNLLKYAAKLQLVNEGGFINVVGNNLVFENCNSFTIYLDARTNYKPDYNAGWRGADPMPLIEREQAAAQQLSYKKLLSRHLNDITHLTAAASIDIGKTADSLLAMPTDIRLKKYAAGGADPDLEEMMFQYGRYLLVGSSRPGGLPANLQGLWNNSNTPPWASDYHNNINVQMNYWGAESTNLSECHIPLIDFIVAAQEPCRIATRKAFGANTRGWTARTSQSIFGGNGWEWNIPASAWYAQHVFEHWAFTNDKTYLEKTAYPILKEICQYWEDRLKKLPDGTLVVPNGWSPEHGPREDGVMHDQQLVWDLFQNYQEAAKALGVDAEYQAKVADMQQHLAPNKIGKWGQLQEWQTDRDDPNDQHRHTSHLFAVYPGRQISLTKTPELAQAAIISLRSRSGNYGKNINTPFTVESTIGDSRRSWSWPWRCAMWARLGEGEKAGMMIRGLLTYNTTGNLYTTHPPFQTDGNFGITGAIPEMLLQSHAGEIHLLPAIPKEWTSGSFSGLKARGGYTVDCKWNDGKVISYRIYSKTPQKVKVRVNDEVKEIISEKKTKIKYI
ncbi:glycoside hydrolase N-terminal domain-containing protein [Chitinophagaceae bacterium LB-8]|uniref:Glycoside hydrolase N-terminal domain-containing protein n=1 Tax=Paraflavisolibacter caeni TaxID=2982496 RepID=A0A9X2XPZ4_9BACT|nr:glycoside hydrolase family 95 protein [Paraflavisolibacter caeni]MCU7552209.1 glycoside hydrolase N-terminal domain-containing protein [Paraflavisolibacter caeni]